jgi:hypothetical protein
MIFVFDKYSDNIDSTPPWNNYFKYQANVAGQNSQMLVTAHGGILSESDRIAADINAALLSDITTETDLLYLIEPWPDFAGISDQHPDIHCPNNWHLALLHINPRALELAKEGRLTIVFHIPEFLTGPDHLDKNIKCTVKQLGIPESQFKIVSGLKRSPWYYWPGFEYSNLKDVENEPQVASVNLKPRNRKFTCLNRIDKVHRRYIALMLWKTNLIKDGYFSYSAAEYADNIVRTRNSNETVMYLPEWKGDLTKWKEFFVAYVPHKADTLTLEQHNDHGHCETAHFTDAYWNFVTETGIEHDTFLSEKTFKPISRLQPFVILGSYKSLELLHDLGYKTFSSVIDESYDLISDNKERIKKATEIALQVAEWTHEKHINVIKQIKPILEHNQQHFSLLLTALTIHGISWLYRSSLSF